jgi:cobalt-zinc-cadmium efflux system outer membrane protein
VKSIYIFAPLILALSPVCFGQTSPSALHLPPHGTTAQLTVDEAVAEALQSNPGIRAAVRRLTLAQSKTTTARSLDDPMFMARDWSTPLRRPWDLNQAQLMFSVQQSFLSKDKRDARAKLAGDDVQVAASDLESTRQEVAAEVRKECADLKRNADERKLLERQAELLKEALSVTMVLYTTGKVPQADALRAQMALTRLGESLIELDEERDTARAALNALMGRRPEDDLDITGDYAVPGDLPQIEELERLALANRPELAGLREQVAKSHDEGSATRLAMKPDFTAALGYMLMPAGSASRNAYMAEMTMSLPWLNRNRHDGEAKQADAATDVTQAELEARTSAVFLEVRQAQIATLAAQKRVKVYRDTLLPQAEAALKASTAAYQNNRAEFLTLIDGQNLLLDIQTAYYKASAATDAGVAELERAIGTRISGPAGTTSPSSNEKSSTAEKRK